MVGREGRIQCMLLPKEFFFYLFISWSFSPLPTDQYRLEGGQLELFLILNKEDKSQTEELWESVVFIFFERIIILVSEIPFNLIELEALFHY